MTRASGLAFCVIFAATTLAFAQSGQSNQTPTPTSPVTEISADRGSCKVDFKVTNFLGKPVYNAKIHTELRWGFLNGHRLDLDAGTNADGRARFINMPNAVKSPVVFHIRNGSDEALITWDPGTNCEAEYTVPVLRKSQQTNQAPPTKE